MYIKQIIIQGFKSYKDQTVIEPFSPKHNVIVGWNGHGKSNFFAAIRFVLSDAYTKMADEERQGLLHEGSGSAVLSAYVEIVFDNSDERFPTGNKEVVIRRTIGRKKDEYSLDRKNAPKSDVMNLLESAGFSKSNPYYIVPQGRVTELTNMPDSRRLTLLKEVAGTQVYEQRRAESLRIMEDTESKRDKIDELLKYIEERLQELEEEKEELRGYQEKDRERRCLEYTIYQREQDEINYALDQIVTSKNNGAVESELIMEEFQEREKEIRALEDSITSTKQKLNLARVDKRQLEDERKEHVRERAQVELDLKTLEADQTHLKDARKRYKRELESLTQQIQEKQEELEEITPSYSARKEEELRIRQQLDEAEATRQRLYAKQGRNTQFRSKKERDDWLQKEIKEIISTVTKRKSVRADLEKDIQETTKELAQTEADIAELRVKLDGRSGAQDEMLEEISKAKELRNKLYDERKDLWREDSRLSSLLDSSRAERERSEKTLSHAMDHATSRGLAAVRRYTERHHLPGVYGTLAELMEVSENYRTAVEVTAGASLFHLVVDTDATATRVLEMLQREKAGRITFMPLNRLTPRLGKFPEDTKGYPLLKTIRYDPAYAKAFEQVFGKTILCQDLNIAAQFARSYGLNAITHEGDRGDKRGALTGGYYDPRRSRLEAVASAKKWRELFDQQKAELDKVKTVIEAKDQEITRAVSDLQKLESKRAHLEASYIPMRTQLQNKTAMVSRITETLRSKQESLENVDTALKALQEQLNSYQSELNSEFKKNLTREEEALLEELAGTLQTLRKSLSVVSTKRIELEQRKSILELEVRENLQMKLDELRARESDSLEGSGKKGDLGSARFELQRISTSIVELEKRLVKIEEELERGNKELHTLEGQKSKLLALQDEAQKILERQQKRIDKDISKKSILDTKAREVSKNIRDLGVLPEEAFEKYENLDSNAVVRRLHRINEALKQYSHVNKKAVEQYNSFTKQRDTLITRRKELDSSQDSIVELIQHLDQRKDEAIERTFKQVSKYFAEIFTKLVPAGKGRLVIQRKVDQRHDAAAAEASEDEDEHDGANRGKSVENYTGVGITVSFNSQHDEQQRLSQLSGGQKSLCALALIFAIQRCDPAPFYLFDEIDANLDAQYRQSTAQMIKELSQENGQFIVTTFRPELIQVADKHYSVLYKNKSSTIACATKTEALKFVQEEAGK
ncbi:RecF/RecN/SMC protein [Terfezia boudieri ATCC MYA-4762]|uniref:Structural maintenance of chromosomes protein n=1 Tax=Terfezia boudieri ATCC MYA-4762 TaxID=1051890 RepID=A0A3N4L7B4_9PEZI|nr:RecF/RecN/SMC protein [Terfezia boudieri ATCC MYA-4762]